MGATETAPTGLDDLAARIAAERPRLVRLCTAITRDPLAAEDLAHETLFEALRRRERLHDPAGLALWLNAIARHVCARWQRSCGREQAHVARDEAAAHAVPDGWDTEIELERHELATLLDRALALLPPETRAVLVARYIEETPHAAIAHRLGLSEGAVAMRLQRGKIALRRVLGNELRHEATAYGLGEPQSSATQTGIWCPFCGRQRLVRDANAAHEREHFYCPACAFGEQRTISSLFYPSLLGDLRSPKAILSRQIDWLHHYYRSALATRQSPCVVCGQPMIVELGMPERHEARLVGGHGMMLRCSASNHFDNCQPLQYLVLDIPAVQQFWRQHPRMRLAYQREIRFGERDAALIMFERSDGSARIEVVSALDSFEVLAVE